MTLSASVKLLAGIWKLKDWPWIADWSAMGAATTGEKFDIARSRAASHTVESANSTRSTLSALDANQLWTVIESDAFVSVRSSPVRLTATVLDAMPAPKRMMSVFPG